MSVRSIGWMAMFFVLAVSLSFSTASAGQVTVTWTFASTNIDGTPLIDLAGAKVYCGTESSNYTRVINLPGGQPGEKCTFTVTGLVDGVRYYLTGTAYNTGGIESVFCGEVTKTATTPQENLSPTVNAGPDGTTQNQVICQLRGEVADDGVPAGTALTVVWSKVAGPGGVTFADPHAAVTGVVFEQAGRYTLRLTVTDGEKTASDEVIYDVVYQTPKNLRVTQ